LSTAESSVKSGAGPLATAENGLLAAVLGLTVALPIAEILLRALLHRGIEGVSEIVQHLTLALGMLGAALAARDGRLLTLATAGLLRGRAGQAARFATGVVAGSVTALMALAARDFTAVERDAGTVLVHGLPTWVAQIPLPLGFGLIAARLVLGSADGTTGRVAAAALAAALCGIVRAEAVSPDLLLWPAIAAIVVVTLLGAPVFACLGGTALFLLLADGIPAASVAVNHYGLVANPTLPAIPMFTLAGYLLAESRAPQRLLELFDALFGRLRGGAAVATVLACTFFTCFTGASGVAILSLGGLVLPLLTRSGFREDRALGLITAAGLPGVILMPALPLLLYAIVAGTSIEDMFTGALLPAALMAAIVLAWGVRMQGSRSEAAQPFRWPRVRAALVAARWELALPLVPVLALGTALATPVEAAAFTAAFALFVVTVAHRDLHPFRDLPRVIASCGLMVGGILLVLGVALSLTNYMVDAEVPARIVDWVRANVSSRWAFLLALNAALLLAGCVMDIFTAIVILVPLVAPLGAVFGIHPVHLGVVFLANLEIGYLTPPVGMNLFFASYRFGRPIGTVFRGVAPVLPWLLAALLAITFVPWLSTAALQR
jgi:tripartite ATP-independent transporter DctM subunit